MSCSSPLHMGNAADLAAGTISIFLRFAMSLLILGTLSMVSQRGETRWTMQRDRVKFQR